MLAVIWDPAANAGNVCDDIDIAVIQNNLHLPNSKIVSKKPALNGMCEVVSKQEHALIPMYATKEFVIIGEMFSKQQSLLEDSIVSLKKEAFKSTYRPLLDQCVAIDKTDPKRKQTLYMITDPLCPHCSKIEREIEDICDAHGLNLKMVLYSKHFDTCVEAVCSNLTIDQYLSRTWMSDGEKRDLICNKGKGIINKSTVVVKSLGIPGVPTFYFEDGERVVGADSAKLIKAIKNRKKADA